MVGVISIQLQPWPQEMEVHLIRASACLPHPHSLLGPSVVQLGQRARQ